MAPVQGAQGEGPEPARAGRVAVAVFGPTSTGKTRWSVDLALRVRQELGVEPVVVSADSRQVYRYMDIGTSKTTREEMRGVRHEMIDVAEPARKLELEAYLVQARRHIGTALGNRQLPVVVGGTGAYVAALTGNWRVGGSAAALAELRRTFPPGSGAAAHRLLRRIAPHLAARIHPHNREAAINTLARLVSQSGPAADADQRPLPAIRWLMLGLDARPDVLDARLAATFDRQLEQGLMEEVRWLNARYGLERDLRRRGPESPNQVLHTHGYREFFEYGLERHRPLAAFAARDVAAVRERVVPHIQAYSRRQRSWFGKLPGLRRAGGVDEAFAAVRHALRGERGSHPPWRHERDAPWNAGRGRGRLPRASDSINQRQPCPWSAQTCGGPRSTVARGAAAVYAVARERHADGRGFTDDARDALCCGSAATQRGGARGV